MSARLDLGLLLPIGLLSLALPCAGQEATLEDLPARRDFEAGRITSADPTGRNNDVWQIEPGETRVLAEIRGPGRIVHFRDNITSGEPHHLRLHILRMYWDGEATPSVEVPIGDFFGVGFGFTEKYSSALMSIDQRRGDVTDPSAMGAARNCTIPMPYSKSARITITNEGKQRSAHWFEINYRTYQKAPEGQLTFHAQYRQATPPPEGPYLILDAKGRGHLIGCVLSIRNNDGGWWGEGDEILQIDGKHAIQGTGSEDYFCESYGLRPGCFPYYGVTLLEEPFTTAYRWHVPDPVPFRESLKFLIEHGDGNPPFRSRSDYYSVAYWYQTEPHAPFPALPSVRDRNAWAEQPLPGLIEGESLKVLSASGGKTDLQTEPRWSGGKQLWWHHGKAGDALDLAVPVARAGKYRLSMRNTRAVDYGVFRLSLDGEPLGGPIDLYSESNITQALPLGTRDLAAGEHRLRIEALPPNPAAKPGNMLGIDFLRLDEVK